MPPEFIRLKEKIVLCTDFTPDERDLLLDCLNLGEYSGQHLYPASFRPGSNQWATAAWAILDQISPKAMKVRDRFMLGGLIAGALSEMFELGRKSK
jgi:hypothetical protein